MSGVKVDGGSVNMGKGGSVGRSLLSLGKGGVVGRQ